jgi:hypothetical protein
VSRDEHLTSRLVTYDKIPSDVSRELSYISPVSDRTGSIVRMSAIEIEELDPRPPREFIIGAISLDIDKDRDLIPYETTIRGVDYVLHNLKPEAYERIETTLIESVKRALAKGCQYICVNELGYPWCSPRTAGFAVRSNTLKKEMLRLSKEHKSYIIAGTFHCTKT